MCLYFFFFSDDTDVDEFLILFDVIELGGLGFFCLFYFPLRKGMISFYPLLQPIIFKCSFSPAVAPNNLFSASSVLSHASLDMLCCALWHNCSVFLLLLLCFRYCGEIKKPNRSRGVSDYNDAEWTSVQGTFRIWAVSSITGVSHVAALLGHCNFTSRG